MRSGQQRRCALERSAEAITAAQNDAVASDVSVTPSDLPDFTSGRQGGAASIAASSPAPSSTVRTVQR